MIASAALTVAAALLLGLAELGRLRYQRARSLARLRSLPVVPPSRQVQQAPALAMRRASTPRAGLLLTRPHVTATPAAMTEGPADPTPAGKTVPGARRYVHAERGRPSTAGPGPRGGGPGQPPPGRAA